MGEPLPPHATAYISPTPIERARDGRRLRLLSRSNPDPSTMDIHVKGIPPGNRVKGTIVEVAGAVVPTVTTID